MKVNEVASVLTAIIILAGVSIVVVNGGPASQVLNSAFQGFSGTIHQATYGVSHA